MDVKQNWIEFIYDLQNRICSALEDCDGTAKFMEDKWERPEGGGGITRVIQNGNVFEKGGVNTSSVHGEITSIMRNQLKIDGAKWFACGLSLVLHPYNPFVPTVHCNYRMFELYDNNNTLIDRWFGGGTDLTPYYLFEEDAFHFHNKYKQTCNEFEPDLYIRFKDACDNYFVNWHRNKERRGIGGIFYDYERATAEKDTSFWMNFGKACGNTFLEAYLPIVNKRRATVFTENNKRWQEIRRGRYVEFNLVHDRGTLFGLKTNGRIESILMSLPPTVRFEYNYKPEHGSEEEKLVQVCLNPRNWV
ncbi:MAG TPA: oxygen-dependent coproporphyrinogen oxidase [Flavisolibacter sp.]|nr:oxygen-dependent coproporphyrinogen oxidase [Flavisolibacter sp.]